MKICMWAYLTCKKLSRHLFLKTGRFSDYRMVRIGEFDVRVDPDCDKLNRSGCFPGIQDIAIETTLVHEDWDKNETNAEKYYKGHDIALVRLKEPIVLATVSFF